MKGAFIGLTAVMALLGCSLIFQKLILTLVADFQK
jgi:hypothetical protein